MKQEQRERVAPVRSEEEGGERVRHGVGAEKRLLPIMQRTLLIRQRAIETPQRGEELGHPDECRDLRDQVLKSFGTRQVDPHGSGIAFWTAGAAQGHLPQRERSITV